MKGDHRLRRALIHLLLKAQQPRAETRSGCRIEPDGKLPRAFANIKNGFEILHGILAEQIHRDDRAGWGHAKKLDRRSRQIAREIEKSDAKIHVLNSP
jgi:hypothetical protein